MGRTKHHHTARWLSISDLRRRWARKKSVRKKKRAVPIRAVKQSHHKRRKHKRSLTKRYYRPLQKLLLLRGYKVSLKKLKKVPLKRALAYLRSHFSQEEIARYMPLRRVFPAAELQPAAAAVEPNVAMAYPEPAQTVRTVVKRLPRRRGRKTVRRKIRVKDRRAAWQKAEIDAFTAPPPLQPLPVLNPPLQTPTVLHSPFLDINQPPPLTEEVSSGSAETQRVNNIFTFADSHPFDPGLWSMVMNNLPQGYTIPDTSFTGRLEQAQSEVAHAYLTGKGEPLTPDSV
jgi:hypothetical protein